MRLIDRNDIKLFPITVPILRGGDHPFFEAPRPEQLSPAVWVQGALPVHWSVTSLTELEEKLASVGHTDPRWYSLLYEAETLAALPGPGELIALNHLEHHWRQAGIVPYPHQIETARRVIFDMGCRAVLADEVGLGKTIEAGLIVKELLLRQMARKVLILTPASLVWQWFHEMKDKFHLVFGMQRSQYDWERTDRLIASLDTAKRSPHRDIIANTPIDILIIDEAHRLKNDKTQSYRFVNSIQRSFTLLLTATPVQNDLKELYNLIHLVRPGQFGTYRQFKKDYVVSGRQPKQSSELKHLIDEVMVRNRRKESNIAFTERRVHGIDVQLTPDERALYEDVSRFVKDGYHRTSGPMRNVLPLLVLQREVCSSPIAAALTLDKMRRKCRLPDERQRLEALLQAALDISQCSKAALLQRLVDDLDEQVIVFTEYRGTQYMLQQQLEQAGYAVFSFDGTLSPSRKEWVRELFRRQGQVLVSTETGGEGLNFQFCRNIVNYDLPWNPMRLEQRIGRVHRLGQNRDVHIFNLVTQNTIEEHIVYLLHQKINMFEMTIGELDTIVTHLGAKRSVDQQLADILIGSSSSQEVRQQMDQLADSFLEAQQKHRQSSLLPF